MRTNSVSAVLAEAALEVLETMCFTGAAEPASITSLSAEPVLSSRLSFQGPVSGAFGLTAPVSLANALARSFLGADELAESQPAEVLCELSNIICGAVLSRIAGDGKIELSPPECSPASAVRHTRAAVTQFLELEEGPLELWIELENH